MVTEKDADNVNRSRLLWRSEEVQDRCGSGFLRECMHFVWFPAEMKDVKSKPRAFSFHSVLLSLQSICFLTDQATKCSKSKSGKAKLLKRIPSCVLSFPLFLSDKGLCGRRQC